MNSTVCEDTAQRAADVGLINAAHNRMKTLPNDQLEKKIRVALEGLRGNIDPNQMNLDVHRIIYEPAGLIKFTEFAERLIMARMIMAM